MPQKKPKTATAPTQNPNTYAQLCAMIGERNYMVAKLAAEIVILTQQVDQFKATQENAGKLG